ncbi:hypothetical protein ACFOOK_07580 [Micromonospora krabiensis]|uniref:Uncharacterized protein n=1 Tax=Micromonospora krabiensis TaxID=307121 RepID=A0A1C3NC68_9ACTN|nr:hypothetical protein [Micromonospora krabiensis]SBV30141.1 hypothetical protein GA0070620_5734 [Micromonospora krabiensis]
MSPLARPDMAGAGALGRCRTHRRPLMAEPAAPLDEQIATERLARESLAYLDGNPGPSPLPRSPRRKGTCPDCVTAVAVAAAAYLHGDDQ